MNDVDYKGHMHDAGPNDPQYEIQSDKTDHIVMHKGRALRIRPGVGGQDAKRGATAQKWSVYFSAKI